MKKKEGEEDEEEWRNIPGNIKMYVLRVTVPDNIAYGSYCKLKVLSTLF